MTRTLEQQDRDERQNQHAQIYTPTNYPHTSAHIRYGWEYIFLLITKSNAGKYYSKRLPNWYFNEKNAVFITDTAVAHLLSGSSFSSGSVKAGVGGGGGGGGIGDVLFPFKPAGEIVTVSVLGGYLWEANQLSA